jgi:hypothetical protein
MNPKKINALGSLISLSLILAACTDGGFQASQLGDANTIQSTNSAGQNTAPAVKLPTAYEKLDLEGYVSGGSYDSAFAMKLDKTNDTIIMNLPIPAGPFSNIYLDIPNLKGAKIKTYYDTSNAPQVAISIPLNHILHAVINLPVSTLPNGTALPAMPSGEAPFLALGLNQNSENKVYLYIGVNAVGVFIENSYIPSNLGMTFPIKNKMKTKILGYFTVVPKSGSFNGGLFCALPLPTGIAKIMDDHMTGLVP